MSLSSKWVDDLPAEPAGQRAAVLELAGHAGALAGGVVADAGVDRGGGHAANVNSALARTTMVVVSTTLQELESGCGRAVTATGTLLPMPTVIKLAGHAYHYLTIFDNDTGRALHLARTRRIASADQRIVLLARDRGCTRPGCTVAGAHCQVHHAVNDWAHDGQTNVDDLTLACPKDNRSVKPGGWKTRKRKDGRTEWIPPRQLDFTASPRNYQDPSATPTRKSAPGIPRIRGHRLS